MGSNRDDFNLDQIGPAGKTDLNRGARWLVGLIWRAEILAVGSAPTSSVGLAGFGIGAKISMHHDDIAERHAFIGKVLLDGFQRFCRLGFGVSRVLARSAA